MIQHIFKIIWAERKINIWILLELILIFCILWFCSDYLFFMAKRHLEPKGFDIEHTYIINMRLTEEGKRISSENDSIGEKGMENELWAILDKVKKYPAIEYASYSFSSTPYSGSYRGTSYMVDSVEQGVQLKVVTPEFFKVYKIDQLSGAPLSWDNALNNPIYIGAGNDNLFAKKAPEAVKTINNQYEKSSSNVVGVIQRTKRSEYDPYHCIVYTAITQNTSLKYNRELSVRVKPTADNNFAETFKKDMQSQLNTETLSLSSVTPLSDQRKSYMDWNGYSNEFKSIYSITTFLIINIFLGIIGTFWFRIQSRRSEIGLRIALGSTKSNVKRMFLGEVTALLFIASVVATILCVNIAATDLLKDIGVPIPRREDSTDAIQHIINYTITFLFLLVTACIAVWYPAKKASDIQPTEALRSE